MPRFRFHVLNDTFYLQDEDGKDLPDTAAVEVHARHVLADVVADEIRQGRSSIHLAIMVEDPRGTRIANYRLVTTVTATQSPLAD
ncbi:hypothetical protein Q4F19_07835 [Sphingomonas sp. BIUV-7]|uniref:DUF6894 domain-containing protein n=1 Tax=Sphingomonas natans TaxID=3063330 RepID=A0ABT8Y7K6_9SPHN|nr:hypothetical protein [Sphingomonas sp. BIUV-7]